MARIRGGPTPDLVATPWWDPAQLLDVDVDELARSFSLVAADRLAGLTVEMGETVEVVPDQDSMDGGGRHPETERDPVRSDLVRPAVVNDPLLQAGWGPVRGSPRSARPVMETLDAQLEVAVPPFAGALPRNPHRFGDVSDRTAGLDPAAQQQSTLWREWSVTVTHGDLRLGVLASTPAHLLPEVSLWVDPYRVTNLRGRNT